MQNLSLQTTQNISLKNMSDSVNKANASTDNATLTEINSPFQQMLNKQVQAQQAPIKQAEAKAVVKQENPAENANPAASILEITVSKAKPKANNHAVLTSNVKKTSDKELNIDSNLSGESVGNKANVTLLTSASVDAKGLLKADADTQANDTVVNRVDVVLNELGPIINVMSLVSAKAISTVTVQPSNAASTTQAQRSLDAVLGSALQQSKNSSIADVVSQDNQATSGTNSWLEAMLPGAAKQGLADESANAKLILNAIKDGAVKEKVGKDAAVKEMTMAVSFQPAVPVNTAVTSQQVGSTNSINVYPGKTGWDQAISQKVVWMVGAGEQSATLTLNPPDLGPLQVVIHVHNDQADTTFISDNAEVRQALQDGLSNLRDKMSESGVQLGQANVSSGEQSQQKFQQAEQQRLSLAQVNSNNSITSAEKSGVANTIVRFSNGLVDTFV